MLRVRLLFFLKCVCLLVRFLDILIKSGLREIIYVGFLFFDFGEDWFYVCALIWFLKVKELLLIFVKEEGFILVGGWECRLRGLFFLFRRGYIFDS